jgi:hypothetical protein
MQFFTEIFFPLFPCIRGCICDAQASLCVKRDGLRNPWKKNNKMKKA